MLAQPHDVPAEGLGVPAAAVQEDQGVPFPRLDDPGPVLRAQVPNLTSEEVNPDRTHHSTPTSGEAPMERRVVLGQFT